MWQIGMTYHPGSKKPTQIFSSISSRTVGIDRSHHRDGFLATRLLKYNEHVKFVRDAIGRQGRDPWVSTRKICDASLASPLRSRRLPATAAQGARCAHDPTRPRV